MTKKIILFSILIGIVATGCSDGEKTSPDAVTLGVDFTWLEEQKCFDERSPEIVVTGHPGSTKSFHVKMHDLTNNYNHGSGTAVNDGSGVIPVGALEKYRGPCPTYGSPRYEFTVKALDENGVIVGVGKKMKRWPPEEEAKQDDSK